MKIISVYSVSPWFERQSYWSSTLDRETIGTRMNADFRGWFEFIRVFPRQSASGLLDFAAAVGAWQGNSTTVVGARQESSSKIG